MRHASRAGPASCARGRLVSGGGVKRRRLIRQVRRLRLEGIFIDDLGVFDRRCLFDDVDDGGRRHDRLGRYFDVNGLVEPNRRLGRRRGRRHEVRAREHAHGSLSIAFDAQHALLCLRRAADRRST
jgi:hypothetical protein